MVTAVRTRLSQLPKSEEGALLSPVPDDAEAKLPASDGVNGSGKNGGDENEPCETGGPEAIEIFTKSTKCEGEESVTAFTDDAVVDPHQMKSVYGDVLSHLIALPFEAQSMRNFHQRKESSPSRDGRRKRKKSSRNAVPIYSQKQYLRGAGLMSLSTTDLAEEAKKKRKVKSSPSRGPIAHSNRSECAEFSPRSVKTLESPKRGVSQSPRQLNATANASLNSNLNQSIAALQERALAQTQQQQLYINEHRNIPSLRHEHELQLLLQQQLQQQQQAAYYDPLQSVHHHLYHQMLTTSYPFNPYLPYQQPGYQQLAPQLIQPFLHGGYSNNPDEVLLAALKAAEASNQNDPFPLATNGFDARPNNNDIAMLPTEAANQNSHLPLMPNGFVSTAAPPAVNHSTTAPDLVAKMKAGAGSKSATSNSKQNLNLSDKVAASALPQAFEQNLDNDESKVKKTIQHEDAASKMKPKKAVARPKKVAKKKKKASIEKSEVKNNSKSAQTSGENRSEQNGGNRISISDEVDFPPGWTTSTQPRKTGRGFNVHYVSPTNNIFRSRNNAIAFIAILKELKKKNSGKDPSEEEALALFDKRGHKR